MKKILCAALLAACLPIPGQAASLPPAAALPVTAPAPRQALPNPEPIEKDAEFVEAVREYIKENYPFPVSDAQLYDFAVRGMVESLDPYSQYLSAKEVDDFEKDTSGIFTGIGIVLGPVQDRLGILEVLPGSPAAKAGLRPGDLLLSIDRQPLQGQGPQDLEKAADLLRGEAGSQVRVGISRGGALKTFYAERAGIAIDPVEYRLLAPGIGYLRLREFNGSAASQTLRAIAALKKQGAAKLVLDLRANPGGSVEEVIKLSPYFLPKGKVFDIRFKSRPAESYTSDGRQAFQKVAVLIDKDTASAAEILAGAIQDRKAGLLIGEKTFGKGIVQDLFLLKNGEAIKMTVAAYHLPSGRGIHQKGLLPDLKVPFKPLTDPKGLITDTQIQAALRHLQKP